MSLQELKRRRRELDDLIQEQTSQSDSDSQEDDEDSDSSSSLEDPVEAHKKDTPEEEDKMDDATPKVSLDPPKQDNNTVKEKPLKKELKLALGDDPNESKALRSSIHSDVLRSLKFYATKGLPETECSELTYKYEIPDAFKTPKLNPQIKARMNEKVIKKDTYRADAQDLTAEALTALSAAITMVNDADEDGLDQNTFLERLMDAAKLLAQAQYKQSQSRRACIIPIIESKSIREILKKSNIDSYLFGLDLDKEVKAMKESDALFDHKKSSTKNQGNFRRQTTAIFQRVRHTLPETSLPKPRPGQNTKEIIQINDVGINIGGRLASFYDSWNKISNSSFINQCVKGYKIPFKKEPHQTGFKNRLIKDETEKQHIRRAIQKLVEKGAVVKTHKEKALFLSNYFVVPKPDGTFRFILNLKNLNKFIKTQHFKLEDLKTAVSLIGPNDHMLSIDMKDAYLTVPICESDQKYLCFNFDKQFYKFSSLPFGLSTSPYVFTKIMKPIMQRLRSMGYLSVIYLDDILCIGKTYDECAKNASETIKLLESLGFVINNKKTGCIPSTRSACVAVQYGWLYTRVLERKKIQALRSSAGSYKGHIIICNKIKMEFRWWKDNLMTAKKIFRYRPTVKVIFTDASDVGWGATDGKNKICGIWNSVQSTYHINYKELLTVLYAIESFTEQLRSSRIILRVDNSTAIAYINRMGGVRFKKFNDLARRIWQHAEKRDNWLTASFIPSKENTEADSLSRLSNLDAEWEISDRAFSKISQTFGKPEIDLFATASNKKCLKYVSRFPDKKATQIDAFSFSWKNLFFYAFPPFVLITRTLAKISQEKARGIVLVPVWRNQTWFPLLTQMTEGEPIIFPPNKNLLFSVCRKKHHPRYRTLYMMATIVSGRPLKMKNYHKTP
ncbi:uncharacterized protein LOC106656583 [Trichogramma pretiosum]|uniref:uncharacterized protein LOC106656583 n=1 Tax=Trichogramma pretiosum TaxID=7493 RepID=UPI0006C992C6|nr:uncharacterized protein LOC106656583 [Trichogramma pretiosum]